jgi:hypothetical protein
MIPVTAPLREKDFSHPGLEIVERLMSARYLSETYINSLQIPAKLFKCIVVNLENTPGYIDIYRLVHRFSFIVLNSLPYFLIRLIDSTNSSQEASRSRR